MHVRVDSAGLLVALEDDVEDLRPAEDASRVLGEQPEQGALPFGQLDAAIVRRVDAAAIGVEPPFADGQLASFAGERPGERPQAGEELVELERLHEVVVGTGVKPFDAILHGAEGGQHQDRCDDAAIAQRADDTHAVPPRQPAIDDDHVEDAGQPPSEAGLAVDFADDVVGLREDVLDERPEARVVLHEEHAETVGNHEAKPTFDR